MAEPPSTLVVRGLSKRFGGVVALEDVDLQVGRGEVVAIAGENGAGKSTLVNVLVRDVPGRRRDHPPRRRAGSDRLPGPGPVARHRDRVPGACAVREPGRGQEPVPRPRDRVVLDGRAGHGTPVHAAAAADLLDGLAGPRPRGRPLGRATADRRDRPVVARRPVDRDPGRADSRVGEQATTTVGLPSKTRMRRASTSSAPTTRAR